MKAIIEDQETAEGKYRGPVRVKTVRDYSGGNLRDHIAKCETLEELDSIRAVVVGLLQAGKLSRHTARKIEAAGRVRYQELSTRIVQAVPGRILMRKKHRLEL